MKRGLFVLLVAVGAAIGCVHGTDNPVPKKHPFVAITGGPVEGSTDTYTARVYWWGWDDDGTIDHYEYAVDPPFAFTGTEIEDPEHSPGITVARRGPGRGLGVDTLIVTKVDGGATFRWVQTREFSGSFFLPTTHADSVNQGGRFQPIPQFSGAHRIYVRDQDNDGLYSHAEAIGYTAQTITPTARITRPDVSSEILNMGDAIKVEWNGVDPDAPGAHKVPTGYLYRMLRLDTLKPSVPIVLATPDLLFNRGGGVWTYQSADTLSQTFRLNLGGQYVMGVRAVDQAGGIEPFLVPGRNFFKFQSLSRGGYPQLTVCEPALDCYEFAAAGISFDAEVAKGQVLHFQWEASAEAYGGEIESFSWGVDIPDLEREGPDSGWSGWGDIHSSNALSFSRPGIHVLYVRVRDKNGAVTVATIVMNVIEFPMDKDVLLVDDSFDWQFPTDAQRDAFWVQQLQGYKALHPRFYYDATGEGLDPIDPDPPTLSKLGDYKLLLWDSRGGGYDGRTALLKAATLSPRLKIYLQSGGKLWLEGQLTVAPCLRSSNGITATVTYPITDHDLHEGTFAWDMLKLRTTRISSNKGGEAEDLMWGVAPYPGRPAIYDSMTVDTRKLRWPYQTGETFCEFIWDPILGQVDPDFRGQIDSLYVSRSYGTDVEDVPNGFHNRLTAIRWHDPDPDPAQGRIQWFGFPLYFMKNTEAQETLNRSLDWFLNDPS